MYGRWEIAPNKLDGPENQSPAAPALKVSVKIAIFTIFVAPSSC